MNPHPTLAVTRRLLFLLATLAIAFSFISCAGKKHRHKDSAEKVGDQVDRVSDHVEDDMDRSAERIENRWDRMDDRWDRRF